jgi:hypothetical protein
MADYAFTIRPTGYSSAVCLGVKDMKQFLSDIGWLWPIGLAIGTWFAVEFVVKPFH